MKVHIPGSEKGSARKSISSPSIEIALATCDSELYLGELLDSLFSQTRQDFTILIADDASQDRTAAILKSYARRFPGRITQLPQNPVRLGVIANFDRLLAHSEADYVFLCDHDDVWLPDKIERTLAAMHALEAGCGPETPLLVHSDLIVTDPRLNVIGSSFFDYSGIDPRRNSPVHLLLANVVTGCASVINKSLCALARPIPAAAMMYDHWLALVAATTGSIAYVDAPTILYRQHGGNAIGAKRPRAVSFVQRAYGTLVSRERERLLRRYSAQAAILLARFGDRMRAADREAATVLARLWEMPRLSRYDALRRHGLGLHGLARNIALFIVVTRAARRRSTE